jgi:hypothetical protein
MVTLDETDASMAIKSFRGGLHGAVEAPGEADQP